MGIGTDREIAIHEAGHAIVAEARGLEVVEAKIGPPGCRHIGAQVLGPSRIKLRIPLRPDEDELRRCADMVRHIYAGIAAQCRENPDADRTAAKGDSCNADYISRQLFAADDPKRTAWLGQQFGDAHDDVDVNWDAIEALADALLERQVLNEVEIDKIYEAYKPSATSP